MKAVAWTLSGPERVDDIMIVGHCFVRVRTDHGHPSPPSVVQIMLYDSRGFAEKIAVGATQLLERRSSEITITPHALDVTTEEVEGVAARRHNNSGPWIRNPETAELVFQVLRIGEPI